MNEEIRQRTKWFMEDRFGMFIHWGLYSCLLYTSNGSEHTTDDNGNLMAEFNTNGKAGVLFNGVWNASGIDASLTDAIEPALFPGNIAIASAGGGLAVANNMSDEKTELALEFIKYMTSAEVQEKIFTGVQANPCNTTVDLNALAEESDDAATRKLAQACSCLLYTSRCV